MKLQPFLLGGNDGGDSCRTWSTIDTRAGAPPGNRRLSLDCPFAGVCAGCYGPSPQSSIVGTVAGVMLGCFGFMAAYLGASWGVILWIVAWIAALWITARAHNKAGAA